MSALLVVWAIGALLVAWLLWSGGEREDVWWMAPLWPLLLAFGIALAIEGYNAGDDDDTA